MQALKKLLATTFKLVIFIGVIGGGYYAYDSGMLDDVLGTGPDPLPEPPAMPGSN